MTTVDDNMAGVTQQPHGPSTNAMAGGLKLRIDLGRAWLAAEDVCRLSPGSVVELTCPSDSDVDVWAAGRLAARGELVMVEGRLGVRVARLEK